MAEENDLKQAKACYKTLCEALDEHEWKYVKNDEKLCIECSAQGEDLPMEISVTVDSDRKLVSLWSRMPFTAPEDRRSALAIAVSQANNNMVDGDFDYNYKNGIILFRITSSYRGSLIGKDLFWYMIICACSTVDKYNDKFLMVAKNEMSADEILEFIG